MMQENMEFIDFSNSFFLWKTLSGSCGRFHLESMSSILYDGKKEDLYLLSSVMACNVYGENPLFHDPPYLYEAVFGNNEVKIFRTYQNKTDNSINVISDIFEKTQLLINKATYSKLDCFQDIFEATRNGYQLFGHIRYNNEKNKAIIIQFPVKHINVSEKQKIFQIETGKIIFYKDSLQKSLLAYLSFKDLDTINFLTQDGAINTIECYKAEIEIYRKNNTI